MSLTNFSKFALLAGGSLMLIAASPAADLNKDNAVSKAEFTAAAMARFDAADADFDGMLTKDEHKAMREQRRDEQAAKRFAKMDLNGDGAITEAELEQARDAKDAKRAEKRAEMKARIDTDGDGTISEAERAAAKAAHKAKRAEKRAERGADGEGKRKGPKGRKGKRGPKLDTNDDGMISKAEYITGTEAMFARMDANGDGQLTKGEGRKGRKGKKRR